MNFYVLGLFLLINFFYHDRLVFALDLEPYEETTKEKSKFKKIKNGSKSRRKEYTDGADFLGRKIISKLPDRTPYSVMVAAGKGSATLIKNPLSTFFGVLAMSVVDLNTYRKTSSPENLCPDKEYSLENDPNVVIADFREY